MIDEPVLIVSYIFKCTSVIVKYRYHHISKYISRLTTQPKFNIVIVTTLTTYVEYYMLYDERCFYVTDFRPPIL